MDILKLEEICYLETKRDKHIKDIDSSTKCRAHGHKIDKVLKIYL